MKFSAFAFLVGTLILAACRDCSQPPLPSAGPLRILIAGQSNAQARSDGSTWAGLSWPAFSETGRVAVNRDVFEAPGDARRIVTEARLSSLAKRVRPTRAEPVQHSLPFLRMADRLSGQFDLDVELLNVAVGGTTSKDWAGHLSDVMAEAAHHFQPHFVLYVQGESDRGEPADVWLKNTRKVVRKVLRRAPDARFFVGFTSWFDHPGGVRTAQAALVSEGRAYPGPDLDLIRLEQPIKSDPFERQHLDQARMLRYGDEWASVLGPHLSARPRPADPSATEHAPNCQP